MDISLFIKRVVSITLFNKGQASRQFRRVQDEGSLIVMKNNAPIAVIISPEEYEALRSLSRICKQELANGNSISSGKINEIIKQIENLDERVDTYV